MVFLNEPIFLNLAIRSTFSVLAIEKVPMFLLHGIINKEKNLI